MAIEGYYKSGILTLPAPHVQAFVVLPRLKISGIVDLLIDTGADNTCHHPADIARLSIPYRRMRKTTLVTSGGIGGTLEYFKETCLLQFRDQSGPIRIFPCDIYICQRNTNNAIQGLPSLLGRDFLNLCNFSTDKSNNQVLMDPVHVDGNVVLPPSVS